MQTPIDRFVDALRASGFDPQPRKGGYRARCPGHNDEHPSLDIDEADDHKVLLKCSSRNCSAKVICTALGLEERDLFPSEITTTGKPKAEIVRTYPYRDEVGQIVYEVCRLHPKTFRVRVPDGNGGYAWGMNGATRVLYGLPKIVNSPDEIVYVVEGEKDCDRLMVMGMVATTTLGGAANGHLTDLNVLHGRKVVLIPDNDVPGLNYATSIGDRLHGKAAELRILKLPDLPDKGDVSDWLNAGHTVSELKLLAQAAPVYVPQAQPQEEPAISDRRISWQPFPTELLPKPLRRFVESAAEAIGCDASFVALPALTACASAIGDSRSLMLKYGWFEPAILWTACVGDSGTMKTPARVPALRPMHEIQQRDIQAYAAACENYEAELCRHKVAMKDWERSGCEGDKPQEPAEPTLRRLVVSDVTVEALADRLGDNPRGVLLERDELAGWIGSFDQYKTGSRADESHWLSMFHAQPITVDRKGAGKLPLCVPHARVCVTGGIQPGVFNRTIGTEHRESGLLARLLLAYPPKRKKQWTEATISELDEAAYQELIEKLLELQPGSKGPVVMKLDPSAKAAWVKFFNEHGEEQIELTGDLCAAWSKLEGITARLALIDHCVRAVTYDTADPDVLDEQSVRAGVGLARWFASEARRLYAAFGESSEDRERRELVELIRSKGGAITSTDLAHTSRKYRQEGRATAALLELTKDKILLERWVKTGGRMRHEYHLAGNESPAGASANGT